MIIVEGPDGAGKTTLVRYLVDELGVAVGERGVGDRDRLWEVTRADTYRAMRYELSPRFDADMSVTAKIWDRLFWSELVYAPATDRRIEFREEDITFIKNVLAAMRTPTIWCMPPLPVVQANVEREKQMAGVLENIEDIYRRYHKLVQLNFAPGWVQYDYTGTHIGMLSDPEHVANHVHKWLTERNRRMK